MTARDKQDPDMSKQNTTDATTNMEVQSSSSEQQSRLSEGPTVSFSVVFEDEADEPTDPLAPVKVDSTEDSGQSDEDVNGDNRHNGNQDDNDQNANDKSTGEGGAAVTEESSTSGSTRPSEDSDAQTTQSETEDADEDEPEITATQLDEELRSNREDDLLLKSYPTYAFDHVTVLARRTKRRLLDDVSWGFHEGTVTAIAVDEADGEQHAALLELLGGFRWPDNGEITRKSGAVNAFEISKLRGHRITLIPGRFDLRDDLDAVSNLVFAMDASGRTFLKPKPRIARELLDEVGFEESVESIKASAFTPLDRRRVGIARALALESTLVVIDMPTENLEDKDSKTILDLLHQLARSRDPRRCVIMVTSSEEDEDAADQVIEV